MVHGPAPALRSVKILRGESRPSRLGPPVTEPEPAAPPKPELTAAVGAIWDATVADIDSSRITKADGVPLRHYSEVVAVADNIAALWHATGEKALLRSRSGELVANPLIAAMLKAQASVQVAARELGLTPARRTAVRTRAASLDKFAEFLDRPAKAARR